MLERGSRACDLEFVLFLEGSRSHGVRNVQCNSAWSASPRSPLAKSSGLRSVSSTWHIVDESYYLPGEDRLGRRGGQCV